MLFLISNREMEKRKLSLVDLVKKSWDTERGYCVKGKDGLVKGHKPNFSIQSENRKTFSGVNRDNTEKNWSLCRKKDVGKGNFKGNLRSCSDIQVVPSKTLGKIPEIPKTNPLNVFGRKQNYSMKNLLIRFNNKVLIDKKKFLNPSKSKKVVDSRKLTGEDKLKKKIKKENLDIFIFSQRNPKFHLNNF